MGHPGRALMGRTSGSKWSRSSTLQKYLRRPLSTTAISRDRACVVKMVLSILEVQAKFRRIHSASSAPRSLVEEEPVAYSDPSLSSCIDRSNATRPLQVAGPRHERILLIYVGISSAMASA